ncbi:MAG TPA: hypothetical protein VKB03_00955 [Conexibacter sp.]|nr:hypothetical protein [Conexibacter sp.]
MTEPDARLKYQQATVVRDPLARPEAVHAARERPMAERLELALSWNRLASQLRSGLAEAIRHPTSRP